MREQPWVAVALSAAESAILVADGTMSLGQGLLSVGQSAATAYIGYAAGGMTAATNTFGTQFAGHALQSFGGAAISNFSLSDNGNFHFDTAKFITSGIAGTAGGAIVGNGNNPLTGAAIKGAFNTAGDIAYNRYNNGDYGGWQDTVKVGAITAGAGYLGDKLTGAVIPQGGNWQYTSMLTSSYVNYGIELGIGNLTGTNVRAETWDSLSSVNAWELVMKDMKLPGFPKSAEDEFKTQSATGTKEQKSMMDRLFGSVFSVLTDVAGAAKSVAGGIIHGAGAVADGIMKAGKETSDFLFGEKIITTIDTSQFVDSVERGSGEASNLNVRNRDLGENLTLTIEKNMPGVFEKIGLWFGEIFGGDAGKLKAMVRGRGDKWDNEGVNVIAFRNDQGTSDTKTFDDVMVLVKGGEVISAVYGSTEPGKKGKWTLIEGQHTYSFQSDEERDNLREASSNGNPKEYNTDVFRPTTFNKDWSDFTVVSHDSNWNGIVDSNELEKLVSSSGALIHPGNKDYNGRVGSYSTACQVIALNRYYDGIEDKTYNYSDVRYKKAGKMTAYENFIGDIGRKKQTIKYNLFNKKQNSYTRNMYKKYYNRLNRVDYWRE